MRKPKISTKRVLGLGLAAAIAVAGTVVFAGSSEAAATAAKIGPTTGSTGGGTVVTLTGKGFQNDLGTNLISSSVNRLQVTATCADTPPAAAANSVVIIATFNVVSATKAVFTTPAGLTPAGKWYLCVYNAAGDKALFTSTLTTLAPVSATGTASPSTGPTYGGTKVIITGDNFTSKTTATIGGKAITNAKVVVGPSTNDDTLTGTLPAGTGSTLPIVVTSEAGAVTVSGTFTYNEAVKVSPQVGDGTAGQVVTLTGTGFSGKTFATTPAAGKTLIVLTTGGSNFTTSNVFGDLPTTLCTSILVESDTSLSCQAPVVTLPAAAGPYTVQLVGFSSGTVISSISAVSRGATYTIATF